MPTDSTLLDRAIKVCTPWSEVFGFFYGDGAYNTGVRKPNPVVAPVQQSCCRCDNYVVVVTNVFLL